MQQYDWRKSDCLVSQHIFKVEDTDECQTFSKLLMGILLGLLFATSAHAVPVSSMPYFFRANILHPDGGTGDLLVIGTTVNPVQNTSAVATQGATRVELTAWANFRPPAL